MSGVIKIEITETVDELRQLLQSTETREVKERVQALYWLKSGQIQTTKAIAAYESAIALKSDYYLAWNNRGAALEGLRQTKVALKSYNQALRANPQYDTALSNRRSLINRLLMLVENVF